MKKGLPVLLMMVLVISLAANFFSFNKLTSAKEETNKQAKQLLEEKEQEIGKLNDEVSSLKKEKKSAASNGNTEKIKEIKGTATENEDEQSGKQKNLLNSAERFIDYIYNVTPDNFAMVKQNADQYMTDEMIQTVFPSDGIDEKGSDLKTNATDIKVFVEGEGDKQAIVSYHFEMEFISNGYKEQDSAYVLLDFEHDGGAYKISSITPISSMKGELSSIDAIGYLKGGGMLP